MTIDAPVAERLTGRSAGWRLGASATLALGAVLLTWALTVDYADTFEGFFGDAATYYSLGHSIAADGDFEYRRTDLERVWHEFPVGPQGLFLKRGTDLDITWTTTPPFLHITSRPDPDLSHFYYAKAFIYPLFAAPFVRVFGTNGFLVFHALLMTLMFLCAYAFLVARSRPVAAATYAVAYLFVCVAPVYLVWVTPDFFNMAMVTFGYFFWAYKDVVGPAAVAWSAKARVRWLLGTRSDAVAAIFLGIATFSKPTHVVLILPLLASALLRRQWQRTVRIGAFFGLTVMLLFAANVAITGEWNYQGGDRRTFYNGSGGFPFLNDDFYVIGQGRTTNEVPLEVLTGREALVDVFRHNLGYFLLGRHTGFLPYFFPGVMSVLLFLAATRDRAVWQWLTLLAGVGAAIGLILYMPFTYSGGGAPIGNRYFLGTYPVFLFLTPALQTSVPALLAIVVSGAFTAQLIFNPVGASLNPDQHTGRGPFRWLPIELTLVNDLPVNVRPERARQPLGTDEAPILAYFVDGHAYNREGRSFWVKGEREADIILRAPVTADDLPTGRVVTPRRLQAVELTLESGPRATIVTLETDGAAQTVSLPASARQQVRLPMARGVPYRPDPRYPTNYVYRLRIGADRGFVPLFETGVNDSRYLGVHVTLRPVYE